jgi:hypothetical protein
MVQLGSGGVSGPSFESLFVTNYAAAAARAAADTGLWTSVVLAQWADETAFGTSRAFLLGNNFAGVSPGGKIASYPSQAAGLSAYIETMDLATYDSVRAAKAAGARDQAVALGKSPWAGGHYTAPGGEPGSSLVGIIDSLNLTAYDGAEGSLNPQPPTVEDPTMQCTDQATGGVWATDENGDGYGFLGAPYPGGLNEHPEWKAGEAESGGQVPCVGIAYWKDAAGDGAVFFTKPGGTTPNGSPYNLYRFRRTPNGPVPD